MQCESVGTSVCAPKGDVCACVYSHVRAMPWGPQRGTSVQVGASSFPGGAPVLSPGCLSLRGGRVLVLRGDVWEHGWLLHVRFQPCCRPGGPAPHRPGSSGMWARNPSPDAPTLPILAPITVHLPPSGPALGAPSAHFVCLAPHPTPPRGFFPLWIVRPFCLPKTGKQSKPAEALEGVCVFSCRSVGINDQ